MNKVDIKTKIGLVNGDKYSWNRVQLKTDQLFDTEEDAKKYAHEHFLFPDVGEVAVLEGDISAGECKAYPVAVMTIKYKDFDGKLWDKEEDCEISNACHVINEMAGKTVFEYKKGFDRWYALYKKSGDFEFTVRTQSQIDALWVIYMPNYEDVLKRRRLLKYDKWSGRETCDEIENQKNRPKWINKLNNIQRLFDKNGSVICKIRNHSYVGYSHGEDYNAFEEFLLVKLGKTGVSYVRNDPADRTCKTCKYRGTDCGYTCSGNSEPRCYVEVEDEDVRERPDVYADAFDVQDAYDWNEADTYDFDVNASGETPASPDA